jgi:hypothetical protein
MDAVYPSVKWRVGDGGGTGSFPATVRAISKNGETKGSVGYAHTGDITVDKLLFPSRFCLPKHKTLDPLEVILWRHSEELTEKRSVPRRVIVYVFVERFINSREVEKSGNFKVGSDVSERLSGNAEERCSALWERRRVAVRVKVSMLGCLKGGGFRVLVLIEDVSESFCGLIEHKLGRGEGHKLGPPTR